MKLSVHTTVTCHATLGMRTCCSNRLPKCGASQPAVRQSFVVTTMRNGRRCARGPMHMNDAFDLAGSEKMGHCRFQTRPLGFKTGQYPFRPRHFCAAWAWGAASLLKTNSRL